MDAEITAERPTSRPEERSVPPVMRIKAAPKAMMALVEFCRRMSRRILMERKLGSLMAIPAIKAISTK
ncbi:hypothetical protein D3C75_1109440 [compost metagenome]